MTNLTDIMEETRQLEAVGDAFFDVETGELIEVPGDVDRIAWLQEQHVNAREQENAWKETKGVYARALAFEIGRAEVKALGTDVARSTWVNGRTDYKSEAHAVKTAVEHELLTEEEAEHLLIAAARELDVPTVEATIKAVAGDNELLEKRLRLVLIRETPVKGYVLTKRAKQDAPARRSVES